MRKTKLAIVFSIFSILIINSAQAQDPVKYQPLNQDERSELQQATAETPNLRFATAGGSDCRTTWHTDPNSGQVTEKTVCNDTDSSSPSGKIGPGFLRGCIAGGLLGALLGSLGGAAGAGIGAGVGCVGGGFLNRE